MEQIAHPDVNISIIFIFANCPFHERLLCKGLRVQNRVLYALLDGVSQALLDEMLDEMFNATDE